MRCGHCKTETADVAHVRSCATTPSTVVRSLDLYAGEFPDAHRCARCAGTGMYITGTVNGIPTGPGGPCFRCSGKGRQSDCGTAAHAVRALDIAAGVRDTHACCDRVRNDLYDRFGIRLTIG